MTGKSTSRSVGMAIVAVCCLLASNISRAEPITRGMLIGAMCETCHGLDGTGVPGAPDITGLEIADMVEIMQAFVSGEESTTIMDRHSEGYTEQELVEMAEYFADL